MQALPQNFNPAGPQKSAFTGDMNQKATTGPPNFDEKPVNLFDE